MASYRNPEDLPIPFSAHDPLSSEFLFGDPKEDELREFRNEAPSGDKRGMEGLEKDAVATRSALDRMAKEIEAELPQHSARIKRYIARIKAAMALGVSNEDLHQMFYGGKEMTDPIRLAALGYEPEARFLQSKAADVAGPVDSKDEEELEEELDKDVPAEKGETGEGESEMPDEEQAEGNDEPDAEDAAEHTTERAEQAEPSSGSQSTTASVVYQGRNLADYDWLDEVLGENIDPLATPTGEPSGTGMKPGDQVNMGGATGEVTLDNPDGTSTAHFNTGDLPEVKFNEDAVETGTIKRSTKTAASPAEIEKFRGLCKTIANMANTAAASMGTGGWTSAEKELGSAKVLIGQVEGWLQGRYRQGTKQANSVDDTGREAPKDSDPISRGTDDKLESPETASEVGPVTRTAEAPMRPRAPAGMQTDPETGIVSAGEDLKGMEQPREDEKVAFRLSFPNLTKRTYAKTPFFIQDWLPDVKTAMVREGGAFQGNEEGHTLVVQFRTEVAARRFAKLLMSQLYVPAKFISLNLVTKTAAYGKGYSNTRAVMPVGLISLRQGTNNILGKLAEWAPDGSITLVRYEADGSVRGILSSGAGSEAPGSLINLFHDQTGRNKGDAQVMGTYALTPDGLKQAEQAAGKGAIGGYVYK